VRIFLLSQILKTGLRPGVLLVFLFFWTLALIVACSQLPAAQQAGGLQPNGAPAAPADSTLTPPCIPKEFIVALDIGHTLQNPGATSARGKREFFFNQKLVHMVLQALFKKGFERAFIINETGVDIQLNQRTAIAHRKKADLFLSIHHDSVQPKYLSKWLYKGDTLFYCDKFRGYSLFVSQLNPQYEKSLALARQMGSALRLRRFAPSLHHAEKIQGENRELIETELGVYRFDSLAVLRTAEMPAVLIECGILVNRDEEFLLSNPVYQQAIAEAAAEAIHQICGDN
jgi:N-acetylmuramoyl-L-alanine amidase